MNRSRIEGAPPTDVLRQVAAVEQQIPTLEHRILDMEQGNIHGIKAHGAASKAAARDPEVA